MMAMQDTPLWRGLLAWVLLADTWTGDEQPEVYTPAGTRLASMLAAAQHGPVRLITVRHGEKRMALGIISSEWGLQPAADLRLLEHFLPPQVRWYDRDRHVFLPPEAYLDESRRDLLLRRLGLLSAAGCPAAAAFARSLALETRRLPDGLRAGDGDARLTLRRAVSAVLGLQGESGFSALTERAERCIPGVNPLLRALDLRDAAGVAPAGTVWLWQNVPFARSASLTGAEPVPGGEEAFSFLGAACERLAASLPGWNARLAERLQAWLRSGERRHLSAEARKCLEELLADAKKAAAQPQAQVRLDWPWDAAQGPDALILRELGGDALPEALARPFSDWVIRLPLHYDHPAAGTVRTARGCMPVPLSAPMAESLTESAFLSFRAEDEAEGLRVSLAPDDRGVLRLCRLYPPREQATLLPEDVPHIALWPGVRLPADRWQGYWTILRGGRLGFRLYDGSHWYDAEGAGQAVLHTHLPPNLISLTLEGRDAGVLFSPAPEETPPAQGEAIVGLDFGSVGTAAAIRLGGTQEPLVIPPLLLTLLGDPGPEDPIPQGPAGPIVSSLARLVRPGKELFRDGWAVLPVSSAQMAALPTGGLCANLKWNPGENAARNLFLRQWMTMLACAAALRGATSVAWRFALPGGMTAGGRATLWETLRDIGREISADCAVLPGSTPAAWLTGDDALAACLREEWQIHGGMLVMDMGGAHASLSLRLRGLDRAVCGCHSPLGLQNVLLSVFLAQPALLREDLEDLPEEGARRAGEALAARLAAARGKAEELAGCRALLDVFLGEYLPVLMPYFERRRAEKGITVTQALILLTGAALMTQAGVMLETVNRDATLNDHLPPEVALCLAGRGSVPLCMLPEREQDQLARFVRMGMDARHPVTALRLEPSRWPKMEAALGMTAARCLVDSPVRLPGVMLRTQMPEGAETRFLMMFRAAYPDACERLFPGLTQADGSGGIFLGDAERVWRAVARRSMRGDPEGFAATLMELVAPAFLAPAPESPAEEEA